MGWDAEEPEFKTQHFDLIFSSPECSKSGVGST
jgi:hypothetical protein